MREPLQVHPTITPKPLTVTFADISKVYDGTTTGTAGAGNLTGVLDDDKADVGVTASAAYDSKNAGNHTVSYTKVSLTGTKAGNYSLDNTATGAGTITAAPLTLTVTDASKTYDGTTDVTNGQYTVTTGQLYGTDTVTGGTYAYADKNAGTGKVVSLMGLTVNDGNEGKNYDLSIVNSTNSTIKAAPLTLTVLDASKQYDGTTDVSDGAYSITSGKLYGSDQLLGGAYAYADKNAGTGKTVSLTGVMANDGNSGKNYDLNIVDSTNSTITANSSEAVVKVVEDVLEEKGSSLKELEEVVSVTTAPVTVSSVATVVEVPAVVEMPAAESEAEPVANTEVTPAVAVETAVENQAVPDTTPVNMPTVAEMPAAETEVAPAANTEATSVVEVETKVENQESADNQQENQDEVETASTTATTQNDEQKQITAKPAGEKKTVHNALGGEGLLTIENEGINPPASMSAENVAEQQKDKKK